MQCPLSSITPHATQIGRCIANHQQLACQSAPIDSFFHIYYQIEEGVVVDRILTKTGQSVAKFPRQPPKAFFDAVLLHPIKQPQEMVQFHKQVLKYLRPMLPKLLPANEAQAKLDSSLYLLAVTHMRQSCIHNPVMQLETSGVMLSECSNTNQESRFAMPLDMHVLHRSTVTVKSDESLLPVLRLHSALVPTAPSPKLQDLAYRQAIKNLFKIAIARESAYLGLLSEDVLLHTLFASRIQQLLSNGRCAQHLFTENHGGVLSFGSREWSRQGWLGVLSDYHHARMRHKEEVKCYNVGPSSFATFAVIFANSTFHDALQWLESTDEPFHRILAHLSSIGFVVRTAFPYLAIQQTTQPPVFEGAELEGQHNITTQAHRLGAHKWSHVNYGIQVTEPRPA